MLNGPPKSARLAKEKGMLSACSCVTPILRRTSLAKTPCFPTVADRRREIFALAISLAAAAAAAAATSRGVSGQETEEALDRDPESKTHFAVVVACPALPRRAASSSLAALQVRGSTDDKRMGMEKLLPLVAQPRTMFCRRLVRGARMR